MDMSFTLFSSSESHSTTPVLPTDTDAVVLCSCCVGILLHDNEVIYYLMVKSDSCTALQAKATKNM